LILKADKISSLLRDGQSVLNPPTDPLIIAPLPQISEFSGAASVDLRLGRWFTTFRQARMPFLEMKEGATSEQEFIKSHYVRFGDHFVLHPRSFALGVTLEWLRMPGNLAAYVIGRSTWGRRGLVIATATGVHPGFIGSLTLELANVGEIPIAVKPGTSICQLFLHTTDSFYDETFDTSAFVGHRKPVLGDATPDRVTRLLWHAYEPEV
jgi:dCTP deaminase